MHPSKSLEKHRVRRYIVSQIRALVPAPKGQYGRVRTWGFRVLCVLDNGTLMCPHGWSGVKFILSSDAHKAAKFIAETHGTFEQWRNQPQMRNRHKITL